MSDLHLGSRLGHDVLRQPEPLARLLVALEDVERLVLLGDIVELAEGRPRQAMAVAEPVLRTIGAALGPQGEVVIVPGNHDWAFVRSWVRAKGRQLTVDSPVELGAAPALARVAGWLSPARVRVHYPGVWLSERVWATHGHYLDRHLLPESAIGVARGLLGRLPRDGATPLDYELAGGVSATRVETLLSRWLPGPLAELVEDLAELARAATMPRPGRRRIPRPPRGIAPLTARVLGFQMRRASIPALARAVHRLGVCAEWVVFGHVHRLGPLPGDDPLVWQGPGGRPRVANAGAWVYQPLLVHRASAPHPYWPGGAVLIERGRDPRAVGLLDDLGVCELQGTSG